MVQPQSLTHSLSCYSFLGGRRRACTALSPPRLSPSTRGNRIVPWHGSGPPRLSCCLPPRHPRLPPPRAPTAPREPPRHGQDGAVRGVTGQGLISVQKGSTKEGNMLKAQVLLPFADGENSGTAPVPVSKRRQVPACRLTSPRALGFGPLIHPYFIQLTVRPQHSHQGHKNSLAARRWGYKPIPVANTGLPTKGDPCECARRPAWFPGRGHRWELCQSGACRQRGLSPLINSILMTAQSERLVRVDFIDIMD